jgi:uncharacterized SAM-binding protein YcdF (DUF218 family)
MVASLNSYRVDRNFRRGRGSVILLGILLVIVCAGVFCFREAGKWLVVEDPLSRSSAIVVLSGGMPFRAEEATRLYREGYAPQVWLTRARGQAEEIEALGVEYRGEEFYNLQILERLGVPATAIRVLNPPIFDTADEMRVIAMEMRLDAMGQVMIVTSPPHTRRVRALWKRLAGGQVASIIRAAPEDPYDAAHWWRDTRDINSVVHELLGLMDDRAGLPVTPLAH